MEKIKLLLADDQMLFAESLKIVINQIAKDIRVVGIAKNGREAVEMVKKQKPDVVLMDVRMPIMDGVEAAKQIHEHNSEVRIIMLTTFDNDEYIHEALQFGAVGYLLKDMPPRDLIMTIRATSSSKIIISPSVATKLEDGKRGKHDSPLSEVYKELPPWFAALTKKEKEVLELLTKGHTNKEIASLLFISEQTVKNYVYYVYNKSGIHNRLKLSKKWLSRKMQT